MINFIVRLSGGLIAVTLIATFVEMGTMTYDEGLETIWLYIGISGLLTLAYSN